MALAMHGEPVRIAAGKGELDGMLWLPEDCIGIILFVQVGGSNRLKPPNDYVASVLRGVRLGTLWVDLLTQQEARNRKHYADIDLLTCRLNAACDWLSQYSATEDLPLGLYSASSGAAAALQLAAVRGSIAAIVIRGGRPDLASQGTLSKVSAPTMLIVGGLDDGIDVNRSAYKTLRCKKRFEIIPGATHAFDEPGSLEVVARLARSWFLKHSHPMHA